MEIEYNDVHFGGELTQYRRENVYTPDGADLLYVRHIIGFVTTYAPGGVPALTSARAISADTSGVLDGSDDTRAIVVARPRGRDPADGRAILNPPDLERPGVASPINTWRTGVETDAELRFRLQMPRRKLKIFGFDRQTGQKVVWFESPRPGFCVDAANGPIPLAVDVVSASGEPNALGIHFQISTCQQPCPIGSDRLVLAHRWEMTHEPDAGGYLSRVIIGEIVFHSGVRSVQNARPDLIAAQIIHPIPLGFERKLPVVTQSSDGLTIRYTVIDTDPTIMFSPGDSGASRIEITERHEIGVPLLKATMMENVLTAAEIGALKKLRER